MVLKKKKKEMVLTISLKLLCNRYYETICLSPSFKHKD